MEAIAPGETPATIDWTTVTYPDETPAYLGDNPRSFTEYYKTGQTKASIDPQGYRTESRYDELNRLVEIIYPDDTPESLEDNPRRFTMRWEMLRALRTLIGIQFYLVMTRKIG